jgi:hypothetical protein
MGELRNAHKILLRKFEDTELLDIYRTNWHDHLLIMEPYHIPLQVSIQAEEMWDDQRRDGKNSFRRILEAERTSWPKPLSY